MAAEEEHPTIARLLTPSGAGAIAMVRVEGRGAASVLARVFVPTHGSLPEVQAFDRLWYGHLRDSGEPIDDVIIAPRALPGGGLAGFDVCFHGGPRITTRVLQALGRHGVVVQPAADRAGVAPSWPTRSLVEAEADTALAQALTRRAVVFLANQRELVPREIDALLVRASTDSTGVRNRLREMRSHWSIARMLIHGVRIGVIGPTNSGKTTLINHLSGAPGGIESAVAGTTRDWTTHETAFEGVPVTLVDTAGRRDEADTLESEAIRRGADMAARADLVLAVLDGSAPLSATSVIELASALRDKAWLAIFNKADLPPAWDPEQVDQCGASGTLVASGRTGEGLAELKSAVLTNLGIEATAVSGPAVFTERQRAIADRILGMRDSPHNELLSALQEMLYGVSGPGRSD